MTKEELFRERAILETKIQDLVWKFEEKADVEVRKIDIFTDDSDEASNIPMVEVSLLE